METTYHKVPVCECPVCGTNLDMVSNVNGQTAKPNPGDLTVCSYCTTILVFTSALKVRVLDHKMRMIVSTASPEMWKTTQDIVKRLQEALDKDD